MGSPNDEPLTATFDMMPEMQVVVGPCQVRPHDHPYSIAANRIHELEGTVRDLQRRLSAQNTDWHPYRGCGDAPKVEEYQKEIYLCMVQRYAKATGEAVGAVGYQVLPCDDNGLFWGLKSDSLVDCKVIAWKEISGRDYEASALAYQHHGKM